MQQARSRADRARNLDLVVLTFKFCREKDELSSSAKLDETHGFRPWYRECVLSMQGEKVCLPGIAKTISAGGEDNGREGTQIMAHLVERGTWFLDSVRGKTVIGFSVHVGLNNAWRWASVKVRFCEGGVNPVDLLEANDAPKVYVSPDNPTRKVYLDPEQSEF